MGAVAGRQSQIPTTRARGDTNRDLHASLDPQALAEIKKKTPLMKKKVGGKRKNAPLKERKRERKRERERERVRTRIVLRGD
jgi:sialic acid synthase SpsE